MRNSNQPYSTKPATFTRQKVSPNNEMQINELERRNAAPRNSFSEPPRFCLFFFWFKMHDDIQYMTTVLEA